MRYNMKKQSKILIVFIFLLLTSNIYGGLSPAGEPWCASTWDRASEGNRRPETCSYIYASIGYEVHIKNIGSKLTTTEPVWDQITFLYGSYRDELYAFSKDGMYWDDVLNESMHDPNKNYYTITGLDIDSKTGMVKTASNGGTLRFFVQQRYVNDFINNKKEAELYAYNKEYKWDEEYLLAQQLMFSFRLRINNAVYDGFQYVYYNGKRGVRTPNPNVSIDTNTVLKDKTMSITRKNIPIHIALHYLSKHPYVIDIKNDAGQPLQKK